MRAQSSPVVIGHRGASGYRPEHTAPAYRLAFALGADAVEPDIVATRDGVLVLRHENEISATTNIAQHPEFADRRTTKTVDGKRISGWFTEDFTWAELSTLRARERLGELRQASRSFDGQFPILRLADLFEIVDAMAESSGRPLGIVAEVKHPTYFESIGLPLDELFAAELGAAGWGDDNNRLVVECFERSVLTKVHARGVRGKRVYLIEASGSPFDEVAANGSAARRYADEITEAGLYALASAPAASRVDGVSVNKSMILQGGTAGTLLGVGDLVDLVHAAGLEAYTWTLRPENRFLVNGLRRGRRDAAFGHWQREFRLIMETGVDGVFADQPDLAVAVRDTLSDRWTGDAPLDRTMWPIRPV
jgi:glycerophosphoryl diester phosphodiesterase